MLLARRRKLSLTLCARDFGRHLQAQSSDWQNQNENFLFSGAGITLEQSIGNNPRICHRLLRG
jgi:hypothetical protein